VDKIDWKLAPKREKLPTKFTMASILEHIVIKIIFDVPFRGRI